MSAANSLVNVCHPTLADNTKGIDFSAANESLIGLNMTDLAAHGPEVEVRFRDLFINNEWVKSVSGKTMPVINPRNGKLIVEVAEADKADVDIAVKAARTAYESVWKFTSPSARAILMQKLANLLEKNADEMAALESLDQGKTYGIAKLVDVNYSIKCLRYFSGWADGKILGSTVPLDGPHEGKTVQEPYGVVGAIVPWNFPLLMTMWKLSPCIAAGNCLVLKSSEKTPLSALFLASLVKEAGFPAGVINILSGYGPTAGHAIASHMDIDKVSFTGSTLTGRKIMIAAAESNLKKVTLELGGKSPFIVFPDVDIDQVVAAANAALFFNCAQVCTAGSRTFVHSSIYDEFVKKAAEAAKKIQHSHASNDITAQGPLVDDLQFKRVLSYIESGIAEGAKLEVGGGHSSDGYFIDPVVFSNVRDEMKICKEEIFGPVQSILKFDTIEEVIARANDTPYGLAASVWTKDIDVATVVSKNLKAGTVWLNCHNAFHLSMPFGGFKQSGIGRDLGAACLNDYTLTKSIIQLLPKGMPKIPAPACAHKK